MRMMILFSDMNRRKGMVVDMIWKAIIPMKSMMSFFIFRGHEV